LLLTRFQAALLVSFVTALLVLPPLGQRIIATSDEARFALLARDILERGAWFDLQVRGKQYRNKPPLYAWSIAALSLPYGRVTEATAHAPVALAAIGAVLFTFLLGDRLFNRRAGLWAALILATSYGFFGHSQLVLPDMLVLCFAAVAGYTFWRAVAEPPGRGALVAFYAALALGVFALVWSLVPLLVVALAANFRTRTFCPCTRGSRSWWPGGRRLTERFARFPPGCWG
jgi:4-amino-4-deoxy-L-arabinose transferase-like glycosyltransferase